MSIIEFLFKSPQPVPDQYKSSFNRLYWDVVWYGLLFGSSLAFISVYAARLGASAQQLGLISAAPAIINLMIALPAGQWLEKHAHGRPVFWSGLACRIFYLFFICLPWVFQPSGEIWAIILITFVMNIPGTALAVGFNTLFADVVPSEWRAYTTGIRNAILAIMTILTSLICGQILVRLPFPQNYQIVFAIGFIGGLLSILQFWSLRPARQECKPVHFDEPAMEAALDDQSLPGKRSLWQRARELLLANPTMRLEILHSPFRRVLGLLFGFHLTQYLAIPLFSLYWVNVLGFSDQTISFGNAVFYIINFVGSVQLTQMVGRLGNKKVTGIGILIISIYTAMTAVSRTTGLYMITCLIGGVGWAMLNGALYNYLFERVPEHDRPAHMAWYNLALNAAILIGSLFGPATANVIGVANAMWLFAGARFLAGLAILKWG